MKNTYVKPEMQVEEFLANQYVAACGDTEYGKYKFKCDADAGTLYYYNGYRASGSQPPTTATKSRLGDFNPCEKTHEADTKGDFFWGFVDSNNNSQEDSGETVIAYLEYGWFWGPYIKDGHATKELDQNSWETVKS